MIAIIENKNKITVLIILLFGLLKVLSAQVVNPDYFVAPVKIPLFLSGNFGELRSNHFHSGIDIKTQGRIGIPVYASAEGCISRIVVSHTGFGLALYLDHPNGTTTVYGHLHRFRDDIQDYVRSHQYRNESFSTDMSVPSDAFIVARGELIGYSGNSGSSGGPHLHFEIRETETQKPYNPLLYNFNISDTRPPVVLSVMLHPLSAGSHVSGSTKPQRIETTMTNGVYRLKGATSIAAYGDIGLAVQTSDYLNGNSNVCGIYEITLFFDGEPVYIFRMDKLSFDETRYINSHIDYAHLQRYRRRLHKTWVDPGNVLRNYPLLVNRGRLRIYDNDKHEVKYVIKDVHGNKSQLSFTIIPQKTDVAVNPQEGILFHHKERNSVNEESMEAVFEPGVFYSDFRFDYRQKPSGNSFFSPIHVLHNDEVPVHQSFNLKIRAINLPSPLEDKVLLAVINEKTGKPSSAGGSYIDGWVTANVRQLGQYAIAADTVPPKIAPLNIQNRTTITNNKKVSFRITDDLSGIAFFRGEIDGKWALFEYDAKNNLLEYHFDPQRMEFGKLHHLKLTVTDFKKNRSVYEADFFR